MKIQTVNYRTARGWSEPLDTALDGSQTLVLAFSAPEFIENTQPFDDLAAAFPQAVLTGCSTSGEIAGAQVHDSSVSVAVVRMDHTTLRRATTAIQDSADSFATGQRLAEQLVAPGLCAVFVLSDGLGVNGTPLVDALTRHLPAGVVITGGLAGDGSRFGRTWVLNGASPQTGHVCAVGFYGDRLRVGHGSDGGWSDFGPERRITRAEGNVLFELDGKPALDLYKTYLGDRAAGLPGTALLFPLAVRRDGPGQDTLVRTILAIDEDQHSLTFAGDMPQGGVARLMRASTDKLIGSAGQAARMATGDDDSLNDGQPVLVLGVSCVGRRLVLGERTEEEVETVSDSAPAGASLVGFYSYGEIAPAVPGGLSGLHNQTMTVTVLSEA